MRTFFASGSTSSTSKSTPKHSVNLFADEVQTLQHIHEIGKSDNVYIKNMMAVVVVGMMILEGRDVVVLGDWLLIATVCCGDGYIC
jgi:hypothetical protein